MKKVKLEEPEIVARLRDYRQCFGTQAGRRVLSDLRRSYSRRLSFSKDPYETAFHEGERNVVLKIEAALKMTEAELDRWVDQFTKQMEVEQYDA